MSTQTIGFDLRHLGCLLGRDRIVYDRQRLCCTVDMFTLKLL